MKEEIIKGVTLTDESKDYLMQCFETCIHEYMQKQFSQPWYYEVNMFYSNNIERCRKHLAILQTDAFVSVVEFPHYAFMVEAYGRGGALKRALINLFRSL